MFLHAFAAERQSPPLKTIMERIGKSETIIRIHKTSSMRFFRIIATGNFDYSAIALLLNHRVGSRVRIAPTCDTADGPHKTNDVAEIAASAGQH